MSELFEELQDLKDRISCVYDVIQNKYGQVPDVKDSWNLSSSIQSIPQSPGDYSFFGISSLRQVYPLSINIENGQWGMLPKDEVPAISLEIPVKKILGPNAQANTSSGTNLPRGFSYLFGSAVGSGSSNKNGVGLRSLNSWLPNVSCISLPYLNTISGYNVCQGMFRQNGNIKKVLMPNVSSIWGAYACATMFYYDQLDPDGWVFDLVSSIRSISGDYACANMCYAVARPADNLYDPKPLVFQNLSNVTGAQAMGYFMTYAGGISSVEFPKLSSHGASNSVFIQSFAYCSNLKHIDFPELSRVGNYCTFQQAFISCPSLSSISFPKLVSLSNVSQSFQSAFISCTSLISVEFPNLSGSLSGSYNFQQAFRYCTSLSSANFPEVLTVRGNDNFPSAFYQCTSLVSVSFPKLKVIQGNYEFSNAFVSCTSLTSIEFPELLNLSGTNSAPHFYYAFNSCKNLKEVRFPKLSAINPSATASNVRDMQVIASGTFMPTGWKLYMPALSGITGGTTSAANAGFRNNRRMTDIYLNSVTAITNNFVFSVCHELTGIHFGESNETAIRATTGFATKWGAPNANCQILFDL